MSDTPNLLELAMKKFTPEEVGCTLVQTFRYTCEIHTPKKNLTHADLVYFVQKTVSRDYEDNFGDVIEVQLSIPMGTFMYDVYDELENVEITLKQLTQFYKDKRPRHESTPPHIHTVRYKAIFLQDKNNTLPSSRTISRADMDNQMPMVVTFQLIEKSVEAIRIKTTGGSFSNGQEGVKPEQFIRTVMSHEIDKILIDGKPPIDLFDVVKFDNEEKIKHILIPSHTRLMEVPDYIQEKLGGIYNDGLSCYIQEVMTKKGEWKKILAIFNLYDPEGEEEAESVIYCVNNSSDTSRFVGGVHNQSGKGIYLLGHRLQGIEDDKMTTLLNTGTGFRVADASKVLTEPVDYLPSGAKFNRPRTNTEIIGKDREDKGNFAIRKGLGHNNFTLSTDAFKRGGRYITLQVSNLDHSIIPTGEKYEVYYTHTERTEDGEVKRKIVKRYGYILQVLTVYGTIHHDPIMSLNNDYTEVTSHATIKMIVGDIVEPD